MPDSLAMLRVMKEETFDQSAARPSRRRILRSLAGSAFAIAAVNPDSALASPFENAVGAASLRGNVTNRETGKPVPEAKIRLQPGGLGTTSDAEGNYQFVNLAPGRYTVQVRANGFKPANFGGTDVRQTVPRRLDAGLSPQPQDSPVPDEPPEATQPFDPPSLLPEPPPPGSPSNPPSSPPSSGPALPATIKVRTPSGDVDMSLEEYLRGVVPSEMPPSWPAQALRAQAVAARTFAVIYHQINGFICTTSQCQVWNPASISKATDDAIAATTGQVLMHNGQYIWTMYSSTCGGQTSVRAGYPYLASVRCDASRSPLDLSSDSGARNFWGASQTAFCAASTSFRWQFSWSRADLEAQLGKYLAEITGSTIQPAFPPGGLGTLTNIGAAPGGRGISGKVGVLRINAASSWDINHEISIRSVLRSGINVSPQRSANVVFDLARQGDSIDRVTLLGGGFGHSIGMCQWGARGMALQGYSHEQILLHYYSASTLVTGAYP
jgi:SpoIID/LytB domain protein